MSELLINKQSGFLSCVTMSVVYDKPIIIVNQTKNSYLYFSPTKVIDVGESADFENIILLYYGKNETSRSKTKNVQCQQISYSIDLQSTDHSVFIEKIRGVQTNMLCLENYEKPLKGISTYKMKDLELMATKLKMFSDETEITLLKKQELYDKIYNYCLW